MIEFTEQQREELLRASGQIVRASDPETRQEYVIVPAAVFERLHDLLVDQGDWTPAEQLRLLAESGRRAGWDDPAMDVYDRYDENRQKLCP